jgi:hypothetical protein
MRFLFLDIDGVLNNYKSRAKTRCAFHFVKSIEQRQLIKTDLDIDEECISRIIQLVKWYNLKIVITSQWRFGAKNIWFQELFALYGLELPIERFDMINLEIDEDEGKRLELVEKYLKEHGGNDFEYVCIDDIPIHYQFAGVILENNLVITSAKTGFTEENLEQACDILNLQIDNQNI